MKFDIPIRWLPCLALLALAACSALPGKPTLPVAYDFGSGLPALSFATDALPAIALAEIDTTGLVDSAAMTYRLQYADALQLRTYATARWVLPPAQLVRQRIRERLGMRRPVLDAGEVLSQQRFEGRLPRILRLQLEEFSQVFGSPGTSEGVVRLRATLVDSTPQGERLVGQRVFAVRRPAATADAAGGVQALTAATDAATDELETWLERAAPVGR